MREDEFRERLRGGLGGPPQLREPQPRPPAPGASLSYTNFEAILATTLAVVLIVVLLGTRVMLPPQGGVAPAPGGSTAATPGADSFPCALPVIVTEELETSIKTVAGFVNIPDGGFRVDPKATVDDLPHNPGDAPMTYSAALNRWLPAIPERIAPNGTQYAYVTPGAASSQLHVVDGATKSDRVVWTYAAGIDVVAWTDSGLIATTVPFGGGVLLTWSVDVTTGHISRAPASANPTNIPVSLMGGSGGSSYMGSDAQGRAVFRLGSRDPGAKYSVVMVESGEVVATIYAGSQGDGKDFDPAGADFDAHGLWMGNFDAKRFWLWSSGSLRSFSVSGLPAPYVGAGGQTFVSAGPAGPCVPGTFGGIAASPVPAPPSPSPTPNVDWSPLLARPLQVPTIASGSACPVSAVQHINGQVKAAGGKISNGPDYGYGQWPAYLTGQIDWYSAGSQGLGVLTSPEYTGPVLLRVRRLDGIGSVTVSDLGQDLGNAAWGIARGGEPPYWAMAGGGITFSAPGCYGFQFDGNSWTSVAVIEVKTGPPPPG